MATINVRFYSDFAKDRNSTKQPTGSYTTFSCSFFEPFDILRPAVVLNLASSNPVKFNYAYIPDFNRYYWLQGWSYDQGRWTAQLTVDTLASWKAKIGSSSQFVMRSASASNGNIADSLYPTLSDVQVETQTQSSSVLVSGATLSQGTFVVGIIGKTATNSSGAVNFYAMTQANFIEFSSTLFDTSIVDGITEITNDLAKSLFNPTQYISSCFWMPLDYARATGDVVTSIPFGWWDVECSAKRIKTPVNSFTRYFPLKTHPQIDSKGSFVKQAPYTSYVLNWMPFGSGINIDPRYLYDANALEVDVTCDWTTGEAMLRLSAIKNYVEGSEDAPDVVILDFIQMPAKIAINIPIAVGISDVLGAAQTTLNAVADAANSVAQSNPLTVGAGVAAGIAQTSSAAISVAKALTPSVSCVGAPGSRATINASPRLISSFCKLPAGNIARFGRPLMDTRTLSTLSGYVLCKNAHVDLAGAYAEEIDSIEGYLNGGFYYE